MDYLEFLKSKEIRFESSGFEPTETNDLLFQWQSDIVRWALKKGRAAIFADCGLGKTPMQLQWAQKVHEHCGRPVLILAPLAVTQQTKREGEKCGIDVKVVRDHTGKPVLIAAPLAVAKQTQREGEKFHIPVTVCRTGSDVKPGVNVTNYEMLEHFDESVFSGVVLDESSILKDATSATRKMLTDKFRKTPYKLCCTATPSPNDFMELGTHSEFLGVMKQTEMLATFFVHDGGDTSKWRLKGHAEKKFYEWVASWACCITNPSDLGYDGSAFILPELQIVEITTKSRDMSDSSGQYLLFAETKQTLNERREARRNSLQDRVNAAAEIANATDGQVLVWCDLNAESEALTAAIRGAVEVRGSQTPDYKEKAMLGFADGSNRVLVSKPSIAGFGMNLQQCNTMIFVGLSDSFEAYYQAVRRCWRFGQTRPVTVYIIISEAEGCVKQNIERKQADAQRMTRELVQFTKDILAAEIHHTTRMIETYITVEGMVIPKWLTA